MKVFSFTTDPDTPSFLGKGQGVRLTLDAGMWYLISSSREFDLTPDP